MAWMFARPNACMRHISVSDLIQVPSACFDYECRVLELGRLLRLVCVLAAAQPSRMAVWVTSERIVSSHMRSIMPLTIRALLTFCDVETYAAAAAVFTYENILFRPGRSGA